LCIGVLGITGYEVTQMVKKSDWRLGSIELLMLNLLSQQSMYGYRIIKELEIRSHGYFKFKEGTLYPVLHRLEKAGLILGQWQTLSNGRPRKYYYITEKGRATLLERTRQWREFSTAIDLIAQLPPA